MKANHGIGLERLKAICHRWSNHHLEAMTARVHNQALDSKLTSSLPTTLLRPIARSILWQRLWTYLQGRTALLARSQLEPANVYGRMQESVQNGYRPWTMDFAHLLNWLATECHLHVPNDYCKTQQNLWNCLSSIWPKRGSYAQSPLTGIAGEVHNVS